MQLFQSLSNFVATITAELVTDISLLGLFCLLRKVFQSGRCREPHALPVPESLSDISDFRRKKHVSEAEAQKNNFSICRSWHDLPNCWVCQKVSINSIVATYRRRIVAIAVQSHTRTGRPFGCNLAIG